MSSNRFSTYQANGYFDEMFGLGSSPLTHYGEISSRFSDLQSGEIEAKQRQAAASFLEHGVTFTVYGDDEGTERIFPFDLIPRIIPLCEWQVVEQGLSQRIVALNLFLNDVYHGGRIMKDGVIPREVVESSAHFRKEMVGFDVPRDIYVHICGSDLIRDGEGKYLVLEDNARCPSGVSYLLENREIMKKAFPLTYRQMSVRSVEAYPEILLKTLEYLSPRQSGKPVCVLLSPGVYNSAYLSSSANGYRNRRG